MGLCAGLDAYRRFLLGGRKEWATCPLRPHWKHVFSRNDIRLSGIAAGFTSAVACRFPCCFLRYWRMMCPLPLHLKPVMGCLGTLVGAALRAWFCPWTTKIVSLATCSVRLWMAVTRQEPVATLPSPGLSHSAKSDRLYPSPPGSAWDPWPHHISITFLDGVLAWSHHQNRSTILHLACLVWFSFKE